MKNSNLYRNRNIFFIDLASVILTYMFCVFFIYGAGNTHKYVSGTLIMSVISAAVFCTVAYAGGNYKILWAFAGTKDYITLSAGCLFSSAILMIIATVAEFSPIGHLHLVKICFLANFIITICFVFVRMLIRVMHKLPEQNTVTAEPGPKTKKVLIVGAGSSATILIKDLTNNLNLNFDIVGLIDDDPIKMNNSINGYRVIGQRNDIPRICKQFNIDQILLAIPSASVSDRKEIIEICNQTKAALKTVPSIDQIISDPYSPMTVRNVQIEDLLDRTPIVLNNSEITEYICGKVVMVTGGGGSIGSELCRQIMKYKPEKLIIIDIYENNAYDLQMELNSMYPDNKPLVLIASVRDKNRLEDIFEKYRPYIIFHAAAHKHVPLMEVSPCEAIKNNVFGTYNVALLADKYNVKRFVMISTDKAVNPTNIMGATKRICEMIVQSMQKISNTEFVAVRFGNVLGSNGSVIPLFKRQIEKGGPVTVTHKDITRFFMTIPEAAQLVLQAASYAKGGEIFVLDMGKPVKIYDLAKNLIRLSGYEPNVDIKIEVTGLRPGEKLYEELLMNEEGLKKTRHDKIFIGSPLDIRMEELKPELDLLETASRHNDIETIKDVIQKVVPTYIRHPEEVNKNAETDTKNIVAL